MGAARPVDAQVLASETSGCPRGRALPRLELGIPSEPEGRLRLALSAPDGRRGHLGTSINSATGRAQA
eukprot:3727511-Alexandrium_andersonii.AAC.1